MNGPLKAAVSIGCRADQTNQQLVPNDPLASSVSPGGEGLRMRGCEAHKLIALHKFHQPSFPLTPPSLSGRGCVHSVPFAHAVFQRLVAMLQRRIPSARDTGSHERWLRQSTKCLVRCNDCRTSQTSRASPAEPGDLLLDISSRRAWRSRAGRGPGCRVVWTSMRTRRQR